VTFDLDNTLLRSAFEGWVIPEIAQRLANGRTVDDVAARLIERHRAALLRGDALSAYDWQDHADALAREAGLTARAVDVAELVRRHAEPGKIRMLHYDTAGVLAKLRARGCRVGILTNGFRAYQEPVLRAAGLMDVVDRVVTTDDVGFAKPDRRAFAAATGGVRPAVHVGDRVDHDVRGARRAGIGSVLMRSDVPFSGLIADIDEQTHTVLRDYLAEIAAAEAGAPDDSPTPTGIPIGADMMPDALVPDLTNLMTVLDRVTELYASG
jgi:HAD superfamily hydrolase (TIGR01549 family)